MKAGLVNPQLPTPNSQRLMQVALGVGSWGLGIDTLFASRRFAAALRFILTIVAAVVAGGRTTLFACPVCFGAAESPLIDGAKLGVIALVAVTLAVQGAFVAFFLYLRKRAKRMAELELEDEWLQLQRGSRTS